MKAILIFVASLMILTVQAQDSTQCNQLPYAKVDKKAKESGDLKELIKDQRPKSLEKGEHTAVFKLIVDCQGNVLKQRYADGNLSEQHQTWLANLIDKSTWKAAILKDKPVSSTVFVTITIKNGQVDLKIQ